MHRGFVVKKVLVSFRLFVIEIYAKSSASVLSVTSVFRNNSLPIRKKHESEQQEINNLQHFVFNQF